MRPSPWRYTGDRVRFTASGCAPLTAVLIVVLAGIPTPGRGAEPDAEPDDPLVMAVGDPLAAELSCPCVAGYAQRDYAVLAEHLGAAIGRSITVVYGESIARAVGDDEAPADIVVGKRSVVEAEAERTKRPLEAVAALTGLDGSTTQRGLAVVHRDDPARGIADLARHEVVLGPADCAEKHAAARALFRAHAIDLPEACATAPGCTEAAERVLAARREGSRPVVALVSSYATPLLEGCGTIRKGELRVIGETEDVPFVTVFLDGRLDAATRRGLRAALQEVVDRPLVKLAIESQDGFRMVPAPAEGTGDWPGWRGSNRDAVVARLPGRLPDEPSIAWSCLLFNEGVGGVAVADGIVVVGDRDAADSKDVFHAIDAGTGDRLWTLEYQAEGKLDYGNSPRATPLVHDGHVFLLGGFGHIHCVRLADGEIVWQRHLREDFAVTDELVWGVSSSPLVVDGKLIVSPGAADASLVALDPKTGDVIWKTPGPPAAYASVIVASPGGVRQLVGCDAEGAGGWDISSGRRLWSLRPKVAGDFNVPTPLVVGRGAVFVSENNGARAIVLGADGEPRVAATFARLDPDMHTPIVHAGRIFGVHKGRVTCLDAETLALHWTAHDRSLQGHVSLIAGGDRVLLCGEDGQLVLIDAVADGLEIISRCRVLTDEARTLAHPALVGDRLYVRGPGELLCVELGDAAATPE